MNDYVILLLAIAAPVLLAGFFLRLAPSKRKRLKKTDVDRLLKELGKFDGRSPTERIMGYDKVLDHVLAAAGHTGTLGEKLKKKPDILSGKLEEAWRLHKIRNRVAHDLDSVNGLERHAEEYRKLLQGILTPK